MVAGAAGLALAGGYVAMVLADRARVRAALAEATTSARKAEQVTEFSVSMFESAGQGRPIADSLSARALLDHAVARAHELSGQPEIEAQMLDMVGRIRTRLGDYAAARPALDQALALRRRTLGDRHPDVATSLMNLAALLDEEEKPDSAIPLLRQALALRRETFGPADARSTDALYALASDLHSTGDRTAARPLFDEWMTLISRQPPQLTPARAEQLHALAQFMTFSKRYGRAEQLARQALALDVALYGDRHDRVAQDMAEVGSVLSDMSREDEADPWLRKALAIARANHPTPHVDVGHRLRDLGFHLVNVQQWEEAEATWGEAAEVYRETQGKGLAYANARAYLGFAETMRGRPAEAEPMLRETLALPAIRSPPNPVTNRAGLFLGEALCAQKRYAEAEPLLVASYEAIGPIGIPKGTRAIAARSLVTLFTATGRPERADRYRPWAAR
jgi:tetratricopeptide (TPR) repeat protein